ncbi:hypothetical protein ABZ707_11300 [Streptomyces sp. NPDC006923]|uniref:hypothetical protein n=1 Tax=Streptomyces sp. NPDC006923 TaxID=3155355 RepID=UPI0033D50851
MASKSEYVMFLRAIRQLHRVRSFYVMGVLLWTASTAWTGWQSPGSRQMWVSVILLGVFATLLLTAFVSLRHLEATTSSRPAHHAASRKVGGPRHVHA